MRKITTFLLMFFLIFSNLESKNIVNLFVDMPLYLLPSFDKILKLEMLENYEKDASRDSIRNKFGETSFVLEFDRDADLLRIRPSSVSTFEMKVYACEANKTVVGIINTVCAPLCSSYIKFYDEEWKEIKVTLPLPENSAWLKNGVEAEREPNLSWLDIYKFHAYRFRSNGDLEIVNNSPQMTGIAEKVLAELLNNEPIIINSGAICALLNEVE